MEVLGCGSILGPLVVAVAAWLLLRESGRKP
jgi:hypothetical protein